MRRTPAFLATLVAIVALLPAAPAQAALGDTGRFLWTISVDGYPCASACWWYDVGYWNFTTVPGTLAPDFTSDGGYGSVAGDCTAMSGYIDVGASMPEPGLNHGVVQGTFTVSYGVVLVVVEFYSIDYRTTTYLQGVGTLRVTPSGTGYGALVDACDGSGPPVPADITFEGVWTAVA